MSRQPRIYLDNAATTWPKPEAVYTAVDYYQRFLTDSPDTKERENIERTIVRLHALIAANLEAHPVIEAVHRKPVTRRWWFWTSVVGGVVVAGVGVGVGLGLGLKPNPHLSLPPVPIQ